MRFGFVLDMYMWISNKCKIVNIFLESAGKKPLNIFILALSDVRGYQNLSNYICGLIKLYWFIGK